MNRRLHLADSTFGAGRQFPPPSIYRKLSCMLFVELKYVDLDLQVFFKRDPTHWMEGL